MEVKAEMLDQKRLAGQRLKILYIQPGTSSFAGIERVVDSICSSLMDKYSDLFDVDVLYTSIHNNRPTERRKYNEIEAVARSRIDLMLKFRRVIGAKDYDLIVVPQIEPTVICMASCIGMRRNFAVHLHGNPRLERSHIKAKILFLMMKLFFLRRIASVFGTSPRQLAAFRTMFGSRTPDYWLPNPVRKFDLGQIETRSQSEIVFVNVGRFCFQKGQDILLNAFSALYKVRKNARLKIVGYGAGEVSIREDIKRLDLEEAVVIEHHPDNPHLALSTSDVYVSTSRWEGWSLAITEALRFGLPVIATDCEFGPSDILVDDRLGRLVPIDDNDKLVEAMIYYCDNLRPERMHATFRQGYVDRFSSERVIDVHAEALFAASGVHSTLAAV
ncbi:MULTISPECIES: glycosyltransferase [unclassified Sinorhizobium]|uniref:glycosyltransferase n=1 Tax=unclassified Sinorhizobium TaxID=2613772 RepID=UPI0035235487